MRAIPCAHASTRAISLVRVKNSTPHFCLENSCRGHCNEENERNIKNIKLNLKLYFSLTFVNLFLP